jgi:hypothetical protein
MFLGEAAAPARPVAGVMADAPIGVCSPFPMGTTAVDADPALSCRDFAALGFRALEALDGAESVGSAAFGRSFAVALVACLSTVCSLAASMRSASVARVLISEVLARKAVFLAAWRVSEKCPFRQSAPDGGGGASPTEGAVGGVFLRDGFGTRVGVLRWVGGVCRARFGSSSATPRLTPRLLTSKK